MKKMPTLKQVTGWTRYSLFGGGDHESMLSSCDLMFRNKTSESKTSLIIKLTDDEKDSYHERKCIMEYDGKLDREEAEWQALLLVYTARRRKHSISW